MESTEKKNNFFDSLVSVVMPVHNGERFLCEAIESVLNQTYTNFEFLIIENCSTDSSIEIIKSYKDPRIRLIIEEDCGQVQAYNRGFKEAKGEYVFIHDQDDISHPVRFLKQLNYIKQNDADICGSYFKIIDKDNKIIGSQKIPIKNNDIKEQLLYKNYTIFNSSICINQKVFNEIGYFDKKFSPSSDYEFYLRGCDKFTYLNVPEFLYSWRIHNKQISTLNKKDTVEKSLYISLKYLNSSSKRYSELNYYKGLIFYYNNKLFKAFSYFIKTVTINNFSKPALRYLIITMFFGIPLKIMRKKNFVYSKYFLGLKLFFNKYFNFSL